MSTNEPDSLRPTAGARFALVRRDHAHPGDHARSAIYDVQVVTPERSFALVASITIEPSIEVSIETTEGDAPPDWTVEHLRSVARGIGRATSRGDAWPRRLLRWRAAKP